MCALPRIPTLVWFPFLSKNKWVRGTTPCRYKVYDLRTYIHEVCVRERVLYSSVVTGTRYGTKTPPGQQPTTPCAGDMTRGKYLHKFSSMVFRVRSPIHEVMHVILDERQRTDPFITGHDSEGIYILFPIPGSNKYIHI